MRIEKQTLSEFMNVEFHEIYEHYETIGFHLKFMSPFVEVSFGVSTNKMPNYRFFPTISDLFESDSFLGIIYYCKNAKL